MASFVLFSPSSLKPINLWNFLSKNPVAISLAVALYSASQFHVELIFARYLGLVAQGFCTIFIRFPIEIAHYLWALIWAAALDYQLSKADVSCVACFFTVLVELIFFKNIVEENNVCIHFCYLDDSYTISILTFIHIILIWYCLVC